MTTPGSSPTISTWAPLGMTVFRVLWLAQLGSNIGGWMQTVGAQWFLVDADANASVIALVQTASLAPALLISLPAGVIADLMDRRKLLIFGNLTSALVALSLTVVTLAGALNTWTLLGYTFLLGATTALTSPAWQSIQPELVPREQIPSASALGGIAVNGARAVGPALAGILLASFGTSLVFGLNALSFAVAAASLIWWHRTPQSGLDDREPFGQALRAGVGYLADAHLIRRIMLRSALFAFPASALWALLPLTAHRMDLGSSGYGLLLGALGVGAIAGVFALPLARKRYSDNMVMSASAVIFGVGTLGVAFLTFIPSLFVLVLAGLAWIGTLTVLNAALQLTLPQWVRSRGAAVYILVFLGSQAVGSYMWGSIADRTSTSVALTIAAIALWLVAVSVWWLPLIAGTGTIDRTVSSAWSAPHLIFEPDPNDGPVAVLISYTVHDAERAQFIAAMDMVKHSRRRTGGTHWSLYRSGEDEDTMLEYFRMPSWSAYRRQHTQRITGRDQEFIDDLRPFYNGEAVERHYFPARATPSS